MEDPLIILAPHRSFTSVVCGMIGQHPQMYGLPEMNFFVAETLGDWWIAFRRGTEIGAHGPLRVVSQVYYGAQTYYAVEMARQWLKQRLWCTTGHVFAQLAESVHPRILVDKSPTTSYRIEYMQRVQRHFPNARFIHLVRHPRGHGESVVKALEEADEFGALPRWIREGTSRRTGSAQPSGSTLVRNRAAALSPKPGGLFDYSTDPPTIDPQHAWHRHHTNICTFLERVPEQRKLRIRGEDLLAHPDPYLRQIADWMGLRSDAGAIEDMRHPERSPFARFGPLNAHLGNDPSFLQRPEYRAGEPCALRLEGPLSWRPDSAGFTAEVKDLARQFGYS